MKQKLTCLLSLLCFLCSFQAFSQNCEAGQSEVVITVKTDHHGEDIGWNLRDYNNVIYAEVEAGTYGNEQRYVSRICVPENICLAFYMEDHHGDGLEEPGSYSIKINGVVVASGGGEFEERVHEFNCSESFTCNLPVPITPNSDYVSTHNNSWYSFTPEETGFYNVSTCGMTTCDTKIWVYSDCDYHAIHETQEGVMIFGDDDCGTQAEAQSVFEAGHTYLVRIGHGGTCMDEPVSFHFQFGGYVYGCTDPNACNFDPLANVDDGSCLDQNDPACPAGPDLMVLKSAIVSSIGTTTLNVSPTSCLYVEQCVTGTGNRQLVKFTTHIRNIGDTDYYIGVPSPNNPQFDYNNCHGHAHYVGYAEYLLFSCDGVSQNIGQKNGFCVLDLECSGGGTSQYSCNNMGISHGCGDYYNSSLQCQWIDVTNVPNGKYILVVRVNWDNSPDYLGRYETDLSNNWASVCLTINRTANNVLQVSVNNTASCPSNIAAIILGRGATCKNSTETYSVPMATNANYNWAVTGGSIVSGQGTNSIDVLWGNGDTGNISISQNFYNDTCSMTNSKEVVLRDIPQITTANVFNTGCTSNSGEIHIETSGNDMPFTYNWSNGVTAQDLANLVPGTYTLTVTNTALCAKVASYNVAAGARPPRPVGFTGTTNACNSSVLTWDGPAGTYKVRYRTFVNGTWSALTPFVTVPAGSYTYTYNGLMASTQYQFQLKYICPSGSGGSTVKVTKTLPACLDGEDAENREAGVTEEAAKSFVNPGIAISPNPTSGSVRVSCTFSETGRADLTVINSTGAVVYKEEDVAVNAKVDRVLNLNHLATGLYSIIIQQGNEVLTTKVSIQR